MRICILDICLIHVAMCNVIGCKFSVWMADSNPRIPSVAGTSTSRDFACYICRKLDYTVEGCSRSTMLIEFVERELYIARGFDSFVRGRPRFRRRSGRARVRRECIIIKSRSRSAARKRTEWRTKKGGTWRRSGA